MGFFRSKKGSIISDYFKMLEPIGNFDAGNMYDVALYEDHLEITSPTIKGSISLAYSKITDVFHGVQSELTEKKTSPIGRAIVGGALFGGIGAIVGAVSGSSGSKSVKTYKTLFIISYTDSSNNEAYLQFEDTRKYHGTKLAATLKNLCGIQDNPQSSNIEL